MTDFNPVLTNAQMQLNPLEILSLVAKKEDLSKDLIVLKGIHFKNKFMLLDRIQEGGPFFMWPIVIVFIILVALFVRQLITKADKLHTITLLSNISLFILSWGILGSVIGLIEAFDAIESVGDVSQGMMAGGLKVALLCTVFALFTFIFGRLFILILNLKK